MEIEEFRSKMQTLCETADAQGKQIRAEQVRACFPDMEQEQHALILQYLKTKAILVIGDDGMEITARGEEYTGSGRTKMTAGVQPQADHLDPEGVKTTPCMAADAGHPGSEEMNSAAGADTKAGCPEPGRTNLAAAACAGAETGYRSGQQKDPAENPCLTEKDRAWLARYKEELQENNGTAALFAKDGQEDPRLRKFMPVAADLAAEAYRDGMNLADLVQEANLALLTILAGDSADMTEEELLRRLRQGVREAANEQDEQNFGDETLVAKVRNLEAVMKDLTDDGGDPKFTVEELAILLDMDIDEMKDIIRLTGEN